MYDFPDETPQWVGFGAKQEMAHELLLAEVVKDVVFTLRSRGLSRPQAALEAYHCACDLVRHQVLPDAPLAQVTMALRIFTLAVPDHRSSPGSPSSFPVQEPITIKSDDTLDTFKHTDTSVHRRPKHTRTRRMGQRVKKEGERAPFPSAIRRNELHTMPYQAYLQTPEWQERRKKKLKQVQFRCQICCTDTQLEVHHRTYERRGYEWDQDLTVLCKICHGLFHHRMQQVPDLSEQETIAQ